MQPKRGTKFEKQIGQLSTFAKSKEKEPIDPQKN